MIKLLTSIFFTSCYDEIKYTSIKSDKIGFGKLIFNETNLSNPIGQAYVFMPLEYHK